jgi:uncharacterized protein YfaP (DUF2135 family)
MTNAREKSDSVIVARKSSNKTGNRKVMLDAETMERRAEAKENAKQQSMRRAQNRESVKQALDRVRQAARLRKKERLTRLITSPAARGNGKFPRPWAIPAASNGLRVSAKASFRSSNE